jgi:hypothetical protein
MGHIVITVQVISIVFGLRAQHCRKTQGQLCCTLPPLLIA